MAATTLTSRNLNISLEAVKSHVKSIMQKLQAQDRTQAVIIALQAGIVSFPD
jgi:DNA-binding NarL/FixJ family response regulator